MINTLNIENLEKLQNPFTMHVITNTKKEGFYYDREKERYVFYTKAKPLHNEANKKIVKYFKKKYNLKIDIIKGLKSHEKIIKF